MFKKCIIFLLLVATVTSAKLPSTIKKCYRRDPDFQQCLPGAIERFVASAPIKEIHLPGLEPLEIPSLVVEAGTNAVAFRQNYKNLKLSGFSKVKCFKAHLDFSTNELYCNCTSAKGILKFDYEFDGKILVLPIVGKGFGTFELDNLNVQGTFHFQEYTKNGVQYFKVGRTDLNLFPDLIRIHLENLFDGDKVLNDNINKVLNENWREVFADVREGYNEAFGLIFGSIFNRVLERVSVVEMFGVS